MTLDRAAGLDPRRVAEVFVTWSRGSGKSLHSFGSGYLVTERIVLTASHVLERPVERDLAELSCEIRLLGTDRWLAAAVAWRGESHDAALLRLAREEIAALGLPSVAAVRWGRVIGTDRVPCTAIGFPEAEKAGMRRDTAQIDGEIPAGTSIKRGLLAIDVAGSVPTARRDRSPWRGLSGAAVFCDDLLVGVIVSDPASYGTDRLQALRAEELAGLPAFCKLVNDGSEALELAVPAGLAGARKGLLASLDRCLARASERWLDEFVEQMDFLGGSPAPSARERYVEPLIRRRSRLPAGQGHEEVQLGDVAVAPGATTVVVGPGGSGKSVILLKLAAEAARAAREDGDAPLPLYARLRSFDSRERGFDGLVKLIANTNALEADDVVALWRDEVRRCLFVLDGLNEVGREFSESCSRALGELLQDSKRGHSCLISSRPGRVVDELVSRLGRADVVELQPFDESRIEQSLAAQGAEGLLENLHPDLAELAANPMLLWALVRTSETATADGLPRNVGQLYECLLDSSLFGVLEARKPTAAAAYNYDLVKKPILARIAFEMARAEVTEQPVEHLRRAVRDLLLEIREDQKGLVEMEPGSFMPDRIAADSFLEEVVASGALRAGDRGLEFFHHSVRDYYAALHLLQDDTCDAASLIPVLDWRTVSQFSPQSRDFRKRYEKGNFFDVLVMLAGLTADATDLVARLAERDPVAASHCLRSAARVADETRASLLDRRRALLSAWHPNRLWLGVECAAAVHDVGEPTLSLLVGLASDEEDLEVRHRARSTLDRLAPERQPAGEGETAREFVDHLLSRFGQLQSAGGDLGPTLQQALDEMLAEPGQWSIERLIFTAEQAGDKYVREAARLALRLRELEVVDRLEGDAPSLRILAARGLGLCRSLEAAPALLGRLEDAAAAEEERLAAAEALVAIRDDESLSELVDYLERLPDRTRDPALRTRAAAALRRAPARHQEETEP